MVYFILLKSLGHWRKSDLKESKEEEAIIDES